MSDMSSYIRQHGKIPVPDGVRMFMRVFMCVFMRMFMRVFMHVFMRVFMNNLYSKKLMTKSIYFV